MSIKEKFSEDEWFLLSSTPMLIGAAMSAAEGSGVIGTVKELSASMRSAVSGLEAYPDSELIQALLEKSANWDEAKAKAQDYRSKIQAQMKEAQIKSKEDIQKKVMIDLEKSVALVDEKCNDSDAKNYKEWSLKIANNVAMAAKEGGFMGFGGTQFSAGEQALLSQIENKLGVKADVLVA